MTRGRDNRDSGARAVPDAHGVRPADLVALVGFDEEVYENHAFARERLARPGEPPHPLGATIEQWLGRGRRTWIDVRGRQIEGIATARELGARVWLIDALVDASDGVATNDVLAALLRKARDTAIEDRVTHLLLRTRLDSPAYLAAMHCGFKPVRVEETWLGSLAAAPGIDGGAFTIRRASDHDDFGRFQLFNRLLPLDAREAVALSLDEWQRARERRWLQRGGSEWVALANDVIVGTLQLQPGGHAQLEVLAESQQCAAALLDHAQTILQRRSAAPVLAVAPAAVPVIGAALAAAGLQQHGEFVALCQRLARPIAATERVRSRLAVPTRG